MTKTAIKPKATSDTTSLTFAHLHLHTEYSLLDGGNAITELLAQVKKLGMTSVAVTDHGNLFGAIEFYTKAKAAGVKPILGIEAYVAPEERTHKKQTGMADGGFHLVLLAENNIGWRNLIKLSSDSFVNGFYRRPRMDKSTLAQYRDGLIAINGHLGSSIAYHLLLFVQTKGEAHWDAAVKEARWHAENFGNNENGEPRFYLELQSTGVVEQDRINPHIIRLARQLSLPLVCDNDVHYLRAEDHDTHDSLCCISMAKLKDEPQRMRYSRELYLKSPEQMAERFADIPEAIENAAKIGQRCHVTLDHSTSHLPVVKIVRSDAADATAVAGKRGSTEWFKQKCANYHLEPFDAHAEVDISRDELKRQCDAALKQLCQWGLEWRYGTNGAQNADIVARLERELTILADKNISAYFLIVWDFVNWARQQGIPAGARGSGVGTMVGYVLGLSNACPVKYGLLFERFTDPDRSEYPDIDIDICQDGRGRVLEYVRNKYGHVAQIITFGRLKAKAAIKDVARVNGFTPTDGQRLANLVPAELNITIADALQKSPEFKAEYENNPRSKAVIDTACALEHHARHAGVHAAGVVIATEPLDNIVPLCRATGSDEIVTQWDGPTCEKVGLLKMDFLGLRTLSTLERAMQIIRDTLPEEEIWRAVKRNVGDGPHPLDLERLEYDDQRVFDLFRRADTAGVFQFESGGMRKLLKDMLPDRLEDLIAANALFRPGPMDLIPEYCMRKHGKQVVPKVHAIVDQYTAETYGIMVYQEQVMQIVHSLGDIPLRSAYSLIKAISKKRSDIINAERPKFIEGAKQRGLSARQADELFDHILKFAGYGFNKSHSTGYAIIAYHTAYLKAYYPNQYMAALLTFESAARKIEDWIQYIQTDCRQIVFPDHSKERPHVGVQVRPPDVNSSEADFSVTFDEDESISACSGHIRFGLSAIKNAGKGAIAAVIDERRSSGPYKSIFDFCERLSARSVNKATIEALVKAGAFDTIHGEENRSAVMASIEDAIASGQSLADDRKSGQLNIFAAFGEEESSTPAAESATLERPLPSTKPWDDMTKLGYEKEVVGFHLSGHPLDQHEDDLKQYINACTSDVAGRPQDAIIIIGGLLSEVRFTMTKRGEGQRMAMVTIQDRHGTCGGVMFPDDFARYGHHLQRDAIVVVVGRADQTRSTPQIIISAAIPLTMAPAHLAGDIEISFIEGDEDLGPVRGQMQLVRGMLAGAVSAGADSGRPAGVVLRLIDNNRIVELRSRGLRAVASPDLLGRIRQVVGDTNVRIRPGDASQLIQRRKTFPQKRNAEMAEV